MLYEIIRSARRTVALGVSRTGAVIVRAPLHMKEQDIAEFVQKHESWLEKAVEKQREYGQNHPQPSEELEAELKKLARERLPEKVNYYANIMGVYPTKLTITSATTRFGSCSSKNSICFSWRLMAYPEEAIDYVVVHELAHIRHHNHGSEFYQFIASVMPDHEARRAKLKQMQRE